MTRIYLQGTIAINGGPGIADVAANQAYKRKGVKFKNCLPFTDCIR